MQDVNGMLASKRLTEMAKIEADYFRKRENNFEKVIDEDSVVLHPKVLVTEEAGIPTPIQLDQRTLPRAGFIGGRFTFRR